MTNQEAYREVRTLAVLATFIRSNKQIFMYKQSLKPPADL